MRGTPNPCHRSGTSFFPFFCPLRPRGRNEVSRKGQTKDTTSRPTFALPGPVQGKRGRFPMKKYLFSVAAVALGLAVAGTAQAARGPHGGGPTMIKSVTPRVVSSYHPITLAKGTTVKTGLPAKTGTT